MNTQPHSHEIQVREYSWFWGVSYGDQPDEHPSKPWRWPFESQPHYTKRSAKRLRKVVHKMIRAHDQASMMAAHGRTAMQLALPQSLVEDEWGSEQL